MSRCLFMSPVLIVACLIIFAIPNGGVATDGKPSAQPEVALGNAAKTSEVHGVGISRPANYTLRSQDITDWAGLLKTLHTRRGVAARVWDFLDDDARRLADDKELIAQVSLPPTADTPRVKIDQLQGEIVRSLRDLLGRRDFYTEQAFKGIPFDQPLRDVIALGEKRSMHQTAWLNWKLLEVAFPKSIAEVPLRFRTVRVQVRDGADVILVLSCSNACRWEVDVKPGGKVTGVILCGTHAQEVELIDNPAEPPVVYRTYYKADGSRRDEPGDAYWDGYEMSDVPGKKFEVRKRFEAGVKGLTGKDFTSFQREHYPGPKSEPYIIRPGAK